MELQGMVVYSSTKLDSNHERVTLITVTLPDGGGQVKVKVKVKDADASGLEVGRHVTIQLGATEDV